jgi:hypothetical protein
MKHAVAFKVARYCTVYVEDENSSLSNEEIIKIAKDKILYDIETYGITDYDMGFEEKDILEVYYDYPII